MGYKVIFLNREDYPFLSEDECSCEVCREIERNVIEPVALFIDENEDVENLSEERIRQLIEKNKRLLGQTKSTCIFHCEKENEVWIKNFEAYINYLRKEKPENEKTFEEKEEDLFTPNQILWDDYLVNEFWKRIRTYRFCIDYWKKEDTPKDLQFIEENEEIKDLLQFYREKIQNEPDKYDFRGSVFPRRQEIKIQLNDLPNVTTVTYFSFWFEKEQFYFSKIVDFKGSIFVDKMLFEGVRFVRIADFIGSTFKRKIEFNVVNFKNNLYFNNSKFKGDVLFFKVIFEKLVGFNEAIFWTKLQFTKDTEFKGEVNFKETKFGYDTDVKSNFHKKVDFWKSEFAGNIDFSGVTFFENSDFREIKVLGNAFFQNTIFKKKADFWKAKFSGKANFYKSQFFEKVSFKEAEFTEFANFVLAKFAKDLKISSNINFSKAQFLSGSNFREAEFFKKVIFEKTKFFKYVYFQDTKFKGDAIFTNSEFSGYTNFAQSCFYKDVFCKQVKFDGRLFFDFKNSVKSIDFSSIKTTPDTHIEIRNLKTKRIVLNNITNYAKNFIFFNLKLIVNEENKPSLEIKNSILNKMRFVNCYFSNIDNKESKPKIEIENSYLTSCEFANVFWGNITEKRICHSLIISDDKIDILKARDVYRQLKMAHDNHKDFIQGSEFYALEMRAHDKYLDSLSWLKLKYFKDKFIFKISKIASNYAQDWVKALLWILLFGFFLMGFNSINYKFKNKDDNYKSFNNSYIFINNNVSLSLAEKKSFPNKALNLKSNPITNKNKHFFNILFKNFEKAKPEHIVFFLFYFLLYFILTCWDCNYTQEIQIKYENCKQIFIIVLLIGVCFFGFYYLTAIVNVFTGFKNGVDFYFSSLAKAYMPWKTIFNENNQVHFPLYKTFSLFCSICILYLNYQLILALRRKVKR